ncbi:DNA fragmentation factor subunit alpha-like [Palaemon carinicauda]|uniref:DNA fragmentation factor subunit alpha-like n=1 Tax=Palaemon carinicauda TaxID=392227 RepID=UPI0035B64E70
MKKPVRVWSQDRRERHGIVAGSLEEVKSKGAAKLNYSDPSSLTVVLEEDGTHVDDAYWETLTPDTRLIVLLPDEVWKPAPLPVPSNVFFIGDETDSTSEGQQRALNLFAALQQNPASVALLSLSDLEVLKDANLSAPEFSKVSAQSSVELQELCIEFYVKKKKEAEALELVDLLKENLIGDKTCHECFAFSNHV